MASPSAPCKRQTDWSKCCLCQTAKNDDLKSPPMHYSYSIEQDGYSMIARNIPLFQSINALPIILDPSRIDEGGGIEETLRRRQAQYHQSCRIMLNNTKLERAQKRVSNVAPSAGRNKIRRSNLEGQTSVCFICENEDTTSKLRQAMTMQINTRLNECAHNLNDGALLAKLSGGDVVPQELKYRERAYLAAQENGKKDKSSQETEVYPLAFSELVTYIAETRTNSDCPAVYRLADMVNLYKRRLEQLGVENAEVNSTRLKDRLLAEIPDLEAHRKRRDVLLAFNKDVGSALSHTSCYSEAVILAKAAKILRKHMLDHNSSFNGTFQDGCVDEAVPPSLLLFVDMIEHGADIKSQLRFGASKTDLAMAQLLQYNCYARYEEGAPTHRHSKDRDTPFPVYMGLSVFAKTRKRALVEMLHEHGLSISYDRVLEISAQLGDAVVNRYVEDGVVCPPVLKKGLFTITAMDNIDHNPTATTATTSFHGTSISVFQHPTSDNKGEKRQPLQPGQSKIKTVPELLSSFTNVRPTYFTTKPFPPQAQYLAMPGIDLLRTQLIPEYEWLEKVSITEQFDGDINVTWSAHHASKKRSPTFEVSIASLMPLLRDEAHSVATIRHVMDRIKETVAFLNPQQVPVMAADQPIYAVAKQIQWHWPDQYGEDKFVMMFGGLHIEMAALRSLGALLQNSGWTGALVEAGVASSGTAESFLSVASVTRTRQAHQITACTLYKVMKDFRSIH